MIALQEESLLDLLEDNDDAFVEEVPIVLLEEHGEIEEEEEEDIPGYPKSTSTKLVGGLPEISWVYGRSHGNPAKGGSSGPS